MLSYSKRTAEWGRGAPRRLFQENYQRGAGYGACGMPLAPCSAIPREPPSGEEGHRAGYSKRTTSAAQAKRPGSKTGAAGAGSNVHSRMKGARGLRAKVGQRDMRALFGARRPCVLIIARAHSRACCRFICPRIGRAAAGF